jgi:hypothetical protein
VTLLRIWLLATTAILSAIAIWAYAPVLVFLAVLLAVLGCASAIMIALARWLQAWRERSGALGDKGQ